MRFYALLVLSLLSACSWSEYQMMVPEDVYNDNEQDRQASLEKLEEKQEQQWQSEPMQPRELIDLNAATGNAYVRDLYSQPSQAIVQMNNAYNPYQIRGTTPAQQVPQNYNYNNNAEYKTLESAKKSKGVRVNESVEVFPIDEWTLPNRIK